jgi:N-acetylglucosamine-6-sulfatase
VRRFIIVLAAMASVGLLGTFGTGDGLFTDNQRADAQTTRPNFVFVMTDDLDERAMDYLPGISEVMGAKGITFKNAYVTYSLCCPSRATILRGQYPHNHGIIGNAPPEGGEPVFRQLGRDESTIATWLNAAGYRTKLIGKYMNVYNDLYIPPGWDEWYALKQGSGPYGDVNEDGHWTTLGGHSAYVFANKASDFISRSHNSSEPFFLMVNSVAPHEPPEVAAQYNDRFTTTPLPTRTNPNFNEADISDKPQWIKSNYPTTLSPTKISNLQNAYRQRLRSMLSVEDMLKQIVATLERTGELGNTYIFFTSDNGYHFGNHRFGANKKTYYEEDIGVPLMVRGPGVPAAEVREQLVLNNDFAPTIADLAGASLPTKLEDGFEVDGSSFAPLLTNSPPSSWRQAFLEEGWLEGGTKMPTPTHKSVHTQDHMFIELDTGERELYDLSTDPYQLQSKPRAGNEQLYSALGTRLNALKACSGAGCRAAEWDATPPPSDDTTPPRVKSTSPANGATLIAPGVNVTATFTEAMDASTTDGDPSTINSTTFKLMRAGTTTAIGAVVSYDPTTKTATLNPNSNLQLGTKYKAVVTTGAQDVAGNGLDQNSSLSGLQQKAWTFTVSP